MLGKILLTLTGWVLSGAAAVCQDTAVQTTTLQSRIYLEAYYSYDFSKPTGHEKAPFLFNHNRHNEVAINLAFASLTYKAERSRGTLALMTGTYAQYNLSAEPSVLQHIFEANAGIKLSAQNALWLDAGVLPSHIGFESAVSKDCPTLTRSLLAENSPYFETGARLSFTTKDERWYMAALLLNGWQRINRVAGNQTPAVGTQLSFSPADRFRLNWSTFIGNDKPDSIKQQRYFSNLYAVWRPARRWDLTLGFDHGWEQPFPGAAAFNKWYSPVIILRYAHEGWAVAARAEYYSDRAGVMMPRFNAEAFRMQGYSVNADRKIGPNALWRIEWRMLRNSQPYFERAGGRTASNHYITTSIAMDLY